MTLPVLTTQEVLPLLPAIVLAVGAMVLLFSEVFLSTDARSHQAPLAFVFAAAAGVASVWLAFQPARLVLNRFAVQDPFSSFLEAVVCLAAALTILLGAGFLHSRHSERGEFYALVLFAASGMCLLSVSNELVTLFINLEVLSIATYALTSYLRRGTRPSEAGFKYFILGAFSTAILLYGAALLYGALGATQLNDMARALPGALKSEPSLVYLGLSLVAVGLSFKVAAVPFHMWAPDVYEGAPTPVTALMSAGVKAAAFAALVRVFYVLGFGLNQVYVLWLFSLLALLTMLAGNLMALPQRNVKRMLAYSSIAHAGYILVGVAALFAQAEKSHWPAFQLFGVLPLISKTAPHQVAQAEAVRGILLYLFAYAVTAVGAFGVVSVLERKEDEERGTAWDLERFAGLAVRRPGWAFAMAAFMVSLAGIPPALGFWAKLYIIQSAVDSGLMGLAIAAVLTSAVGAYYYLRVVVYMYMRPVPAVPGELPRHFSTEVALWLSTAAVVFLGLFPGPLSTWLSQAGLLFGGP